MQEPENLNENAPPITNPNPIVNVQPITNAQPIAPPMAREKSRPNLVVNFGSVCLMLLAFWVQVPHFSPLLKFVLLGLVAALARKSSSEMVQSAAKSALWTWVFLALAGVLISIYLISSLRTGFKGL